MATPDAPTFVIPDEKTPRVFGILNIVFASLLLLQNVSTLVMYLAAPAITRFLEQMQDQVNKPIQARYEERHAQLKLEESTATTEVEKARAKAALAAFEAQPRPPIAPMAMGMTSLQHPTIRAFGITDGVTGMILNLGLLVGGVWLLKPREKGRKLVVYVAAIKLVRLVIISAITVLVIAPIQAKMMEAEMAPMVAQFKAQPGGGAVANMLSPQAMAAMTIAGTAVSMTLAAIYPILLLVMLNKPRVKLACAGDKPRISEGNW